MVRQKEETMRNRGKYYVLWFGPFKNKSIEQIMLMPGGYRYLLELLRILRKGSTLRRPHMVQYIEEVLRRGETLPVLAKCFCGKNTASHFATFIDDRGYYSFGPTFCADCKGDIPLDKPYPPRICFSSLLLVPGDKRTQKEALRIFKYSYFLGERRATRRTALKLFFPELFGKSRINGEKSPNGPASSPGSKGKTSKPGKARPTGKGSRLKPAVPAIQLALF
ncbi:MAG: hypothetical protein FJZ04_02465 [Candidatus Moranbacteria bacterium]|nr:hypothetical protein [Candidatus Moranbacteria bacterium]